jgi:hypothetical protein
VLPLALTFRAATLRVRAISKPANHGRKRSKIRWEGCSLSFRLLLRRDRGWTALSKPRGINADIQSPRTKLLYFIYSASNSRIKAEPGVKSSLSAALGYKSDGHFHYDWNYLLSAGMIEEKQGYFLVTEDGKKEFALHSTASRSNTIMVVLGVALIFFTFSLKMELLPDESVLFFGVTLIVIGSVFWAVSRKNKPELSPEAKELLKELNRH